MITHLRSSTTIRGNSVEAKDGWSCYCCFGCCFWSHRLYSNCCFCVHCQEVLWAFGDVPEESGVVCRQTLSAPDQCPSCSPFRIPQRLCYGHSASSWNKRDQTLLPSWLRGSSPGRGACCPVLSAT